MCHNILRRGLVLRIPLVLEREETAGGRWNDARLGGGSRGRKRKTNTKR
jgi:hypothetical protein